MQVSNSTAAQDPLAWCAVRQATVSWSQDDEGCVLLILRCAAGLGGERVVGVRANGCVDPTRLLAAAVTEAQRGESAQAGTRLRHLHLVTGA